MKKSSIVILTLLVLLVLGGAFYWFEYRPSQIRKDCARRAEDILKSEQRSVPENAAIGLGEYERYVYERCIHLQGI